MGGFRFEGPEHRKIGDAILLRLPTGNIDGKDFSYQVGKKNIKLSYGQIVSLAGDFYGNCKYLGDAEQISDKWDGDPDASIARFVKNADLLQLDKAGYLKDVIRIMEDQEKEVKQALKDGKDIAQVYKAIGDKFNTAWAKATRFDYLLLSLCNWDHFGEDAVKAYKAGHSAALSQAKVAHGSGNVIDLRRAYFLEAFAAHFLTDLFSSGHMRTPRRILHRTYTVTRPEEVHQQLEEGLWPNMWPADQCAQAMHDEDCANGLWALNATGRRWPTYGDKQLVSSKGNVDFDAALAAVQAGAHEVHEVYETGQDRQVSDFAALGMVPDLDSLSSFNYAPLFDVTQDGQTLRFRSSLDDRSVATYEEYPLAEAPFSNLLDRIKNSGQYQHQLPLTLPFLSPSSLLHLRETSNTVLSAAEYGPAFSQSAVDKGANVESWNMLSQETIDMPDPSGKVTWLAADKIDSDVYFLVGKVEKPNVHIAYHLGITVKDHHIEVASQRSDEDSNASWSAGDIRFGKLSAGSSKLAMVKCWYRAGAPWKPKFELWTFQQGVRESPTRSSLKWPNAPSSAPFASFCTYIDSDDQCETYVTCSATGSKTTWTFTNFDNDYKHLKSWTFEEDVGERAQRILPLPTSKCGPCRLVRLFYGQGSNELRLDTLTIQNHSVSVDSTIRIPVDWSGTAEEQYLTWFLADANSNGHLDLVGLVTNQEGGLTVLAIPGQADSTFEARAVQSAITSDKGDKLTAPFMKPVAARQARCKYLGTSDETGAAIMALFDNYGILGVRVIRPAQAAGTLTYEIAGQIPAVAGQVSSCLGWSTREYKPGREAVGFFVE
ncbi:hypothetical protein DBV05_g11793 [Lasiodiplodia theobromae]|uniref:Phosphatidylcholine-hydrolyzing phospholipase C n=1 Tax=Lasiodiplodia theobromae TaxID=45133 RepID=A0A5N5CW34_9PEZI|nr:hypothetical protein DBV05_g11793 [Lasiodiplodia theobromae]